MENEKGRLWGKVPRVRPPNRKKTLHLQPLFHPTTSISRNNNNNNNINNKI